MSTVRFRKVFGVRGKNPIVVARVDGQWRVRWNPHTQWRCSCGDDACGHVELVADMLDPGVTNGTDLEPKTDTRRTK